MSSEDFRAYVLIEIHPGKEQEFNEYVMSKDLAKNINVEKIDFVHGSFDVVMLLRGTMKSIDARIMQLRKSPLICRTETLLCFEMPDWEEISGRMDE